MSVQTSPKPTEQLFTVTEVADPLALPAYPAEVLDTEDKLAAQRRKYALGLFNFHQSKTNEDKARRDSQDSTLSDQSA